MIPVTENSATDSLVEAPLPVRPERPVVDLQELTLERRARARSVLDELGVDGLVLLSRPAVQYVTGYRSLGADLYGTHRMAAVVTADDCWLICPAGDAAAAVEAGVPLDRVVPFGTFFFESVDDSPLSQNVGRHPNVEAALAHVISAVGKGSYSWGSEGISPAPVFGDRATVIDASEHLQRVRSRKLDGEIALIRYSALLTEAAIASAVAAATTGSTEAEIAAHVAGVMVAGGGAPRFVVVGTGTRSALSDSFATSRSWAPGEVLRFDAGCVVDGYWSDLGRTVVLGVPTQVQAVRYGALLAGQEAALAALRPGVTGRELFETAVRTVNGRGLPYRRQHCGHGIGLEIYEHPMISPDGEAGIESTATLCVETPYYELGWAGMMVEDTVVVTDSGYERLNITDRRLWVASA